MGKIPEFSRTVLPQRAQYGLVDAERTRGESQAAQFRQNAANIEEGRHLSNQIGHTLNMVKLREAEAENTTWVNENVIQYKRDLTDAVDTARKERAENPKNFHKDFDKQADKMALSFAKAAPSEAARIAIRQSTNTIRSSYYDDNLGWESSRQVERFGESMERAADNLNVMAYRAGQDGKDLDQAGFLKDVQASVVAGSTFVAGDKLDRVQTTMSKNVVSSYMEGLFEKNPAKAKELLNSRKYDKILGAEELQRFDSKIKAQERIEISDDVEEIETAAKLGIMVPKEKISEVVGRMESAGLNEQAANLREYAAVQDVVVDFAQKPMTEQSADLTALKASIEGGNLAGVKKYAAMAEVFQTKQEAIQKDPWSYYAARDVVADPEAIDFSDPQAMGAELEKRRIAVQQVRDLDGITMPLFNSNELDSLKKVYETSKPDEVAALLSTMGNSMKPDEQTALAQAMAPKSGALAVALAVSDPQVGERIIMGSQIDGLVTEKDVRAEVLGKLDGVVTDPVRFEKLNGAIYSYYKTLQFQAKDKNTNVNGDYVDQAITDIMGPVVSVDTRFGLGGTSKVLSYKDQTTGAWVDGDSLRDTLKALNDDRIKMLNGGNLPVGTAGAKFTAKDIYKTGRFVSNGDGFYAVIDEMGEPIGNEDGSIFQIDARKLTNIIRGGE
jgi:hypothetical protein